jgi:hypothetical protein
VIELREDRRFGAKRLMTSVLARSDSAS